MKKEKPVTTRIDYDVLFASYYEHELKVLESELQEKCKDEDLSQESIYARFLQYISQRIETHYDNGKDHFMRMFQTQYFAVVVKPKLYIKDPVKNYFERDEYGHVKQLRKESIEFSIQHSLDSPSLKFSNQKLVKILAGFCALHKIQKIVSVQLQELRSINEESSQVSYRINVDNKNKGALSSIIRIFNSAIKSNIIDNSTRDVDFGNILFVNNQPYTGKNYSDLKTKIMNRENSSSLFLEFILDCYNNLSAADKRKFKESINKK
ncbi:MAG: hypothetical protein JNJ85_02445 [Candidatus Kapabacteria bacterium]|nr:hypothetical protein [Candidatus Kapabacteria bacterium]